MGKATTEQEIKRRLQYVLNGFNEGQTMIEIAKGLGLSKQALGVFLDKYWPASEKNRKKLNEKNKTNENL